MKNNAIVRIILLSLAIVILTCILVGVLFLNHFTFISDPIIDTKEDTMELDIRSTMDASTIHGLEIEWANGHIIVDAVSGTNEITIHETSKSSENYPTVWSISEDTLYIGFAQEVFEFPDVGFHESITKDLVVLVPADWNCEELSIESASADVVIQNLTIGEAEFSSASGTVKMENCSVRELDVKTASGDVTFNGTLNQLNYAAMSASFQGYIHNVPQSIEAESMSGNLDLHLPNDCGFTMTGTSTSGHFNSDFEVTNNNNQMTHGDGQCEIKVTTMSGNVNIHKHATASDTTPCDDPNCTDADHSHDTECTDENCTDSAHNHSTVCNDTSCTDTTHNHQSNHSSTSSHHSESEHH